jgi:hypothetical protein
MSTTDTRYPYTHSADFIRGLAGDHCDEDGQLRGTKLYRADAAKIVQTIADILGMDPRTLHEAIADRALKERETK